MSRPFRNHPSFDKTSAQSQIADHIQKFVTGGLVVEIQVQIIQNAFFNFYIVITEQFHQTVCFFLIDFTIDDHDRIG